MNPVFRLVRGDEVLLKTERGTYPVVILSLEDPKRAYVQHENGDCVWADRTDLHPFV